MSPQVMLYDEPTSALDPELVEEVIATMNNLSKEGMTQIVVTHRFGFAKNHSDKVVFMEDGKIIEFNDAKTIFHNPKDERTQRFISLLKE